MKTKLIAYQLKDVAKVWYEQQKGERPVGARPIDWELLKPIFLDTLFPLKLRERKMQELINLRLGL